MKKYFKILGVVFLFISFMLPIHAKEKGELNFMVEAILPEKQVNKDALYFHLDASKGLEEELHLVITNFSDKDIEIKASAQTAMTNRHGMIVYDEAFDPQNFTENVFDLSEFIQFDQDTVLVEGGTSQNIIVKIELDTEKAPQKGIYLAGLHFEPIRDEEKEGLSSVYVYNIPLVMSSTKEAIRSSSTLEYDSVKLELLDNLRTVVFAFENPENTVLSDLSLELSLETPNGQKILSDKKASLEMAPLSKMDYALDWGKKDISAGKYPVKIKAESHDHKWEWEDSLVIDAKKARELNEGAMNRVRLTKISFWGMIVLGTLSLVTIIRLVKVGRKQWGEA